MSANRSGLNALKPEMKGWILVRALATAGVTSAILGGCALLDGNTNYGASNNPEMDIRPLPLITRGEKSPDAYYALGKYYLYQGRLEQAREAFWDAVQMDQNHVDALNGLGVVYDKLGQYDAARKVYETALLKDPSASHVWANLGYSLKLAGKNTESIAPLQTAIALDPENTIARQNLASVEAGIPASSASPRSARQEQIVFAERTNQNVEVTSDVSAANKLADKKESNAVVSNSMQEAPLYASVAVEDKARKAVTQSSPEGQPEKNGNLGNVQYMGNSDAITKPVIASVINQSKANGGIVVRQTQAVQISHQEKSALASNAPMAKPPTLPKVKVATTASLPEKKDSGILDDLRIEVSNGNGITGMARAVGAEMSLKGLNVKRITNAKPFNKPQTLIMCSPELKSAAEALAQTMRSTPKIVLSDVAHRRVDVRVVLGSDTAVAWEEGSKGPYLVASLAK